MKYYEEDYVEEATPVQELEYGCKFCWDGRVKKEKELFFFDQANNMRICLFCPNCGRKYNGD